MRPSAYAVEVAGAQDVAHPAVHKAASAASCSAGDSVDCQHAGPPRCRSRPRHRRAGRGGPVRRGEPSTAAGGRRPALARTARAADPPLATDRPADPRAAQRPARRAGASVGRRAGSGTARCARRHQCTAGGRHRAADRRVGDGGGAEGNTATPNPGRTRAGDPPLPRSGRPAHRHPAHGTSRRGRARGTVGDDGQAGDVLPDARCAAGPVPAGRAQ